MEREAIEKIIELTNKSNTLIEMDGVKFSYSDLKPVSDGRTVETITIHTLKGFTDFVKHEKKEGVVIVKDYDSVVFASPIEKNMKRNIFVRCELIKPEREFRFGNFYDSEEFIIKLKSLFSETESQRKLLSFASKLCIDNSIDIEDDGVSQKATVKKGMSGALKEQQQAPSIVSLSPFRTFLEIEQPKSDFLFRMKAYEDRVPTCALFEADGGRWKLDTILSIHNYIKSQLKDQVIIS